MKTMTCKQLGGACEVEFRAETFDEIAKLSQKHGSEMFSKEDEAHLEAMNNLTQMMSDPDSMKEWMDERRSDFEALPED